MTLQKWLAEDWGTNQVLGGWGHEIGVNPGDAPIQVINIDLPYPTTLAIRFNPTNVDGTPALNMRLTLNWGNGNAQFTRILAPGVYYIGGRNFRGVVGLDAQHQDPEKCRVIAWLPVMADNVP